MRSQVRIFLYKFANRKTILTLDDNRGISIGQHKHFNNAGDRAKTIDIFQRGLFHLLVFLRKHAYNSVALVGLLDEPDGFLTSDRDGNNHTWKQNGILDWKNRNFFREIFRL